MKKETTKQTKTKKGSANKKTVEPVQEVQQAQTYVAEVAPLVHLDNIHLAYDLTGKKIVVFYSEKDKNDNYVVSPSNVKDITDEFLQVILVLCANSENNTVLHGNSKTDELFTIFHKAPLGTTVEDVKKLLV